MPVVTMHFLDEPFRIRMPQNALFVFGVHKSGSSLLNQVSSYLAQRNDANWVSIPDQLFLKNIDFEVAYNGDIPDHLIHPGNVYGGFRRFPKSLAKNAHFQEGRKILLVRDPRDALVSQFFSFAKSHLVPEGDDGDGPRKKIMETRREIANLSIDQYVVRGAYEMNMVMCGYADMVHDPSCLVMRYEDMIFAKRDLLQAICGHFGWFITSQDLDDILHHVDIRPSKEDPTQFIRKVTPGDYLEKLTEQSIRTLNGQLDQAMTLFGYDQ